jgi:ATP-grasp domain/L-amino acid ligase C-terminal domain 2/ATP-grasp N-terminal domain
MPPTKKVLLFASKIGYQTRAFNAVAEKLGVELVFVTDRCHRLDDPWRDLALSVHFENPEEAAYSVVKSLDGRPIDGILALGDRPTPAAAYAARRLGLLFHHPASAEACRSKLRMREVFRDAGLPSPWFRVVPLHSIPEPALLGITYPCVLKPLSLSASQGVVRANNREEFIAGATRLKRLLESAEIQATRECNLDQMLVEGYLPGREVAVEGLLTEGELRTLAAFDKPDPLEGPYFEETIYVSPSQLPTTSQDAIEHSFLSTVHAMGLTHGPVHAEFRVNDDGIWPLEIAPRPIGGMCARAIRFQPKDGAELMPLEELLLRHALTMPGAEALRERSASGVMMIPVPKSGTFEKLEGEEEARNVPGIVGLEITARLHDYIFAWPEGSSYLGFLFASGDQPREVESSIRTAHSKLQFTLVPRLPVEHPVTGKISTS